MSLTYRTAMAMSAPAVGGWGRLAVRGLENVPRTGPLVLAGNHDSHWDPVVVGVALRRHRPVCALAKASMWERPGLRHVLDGMQQIPLRRGEGDDAALETAVTRLREGACIGMFPEGTLSFGRTVRPRSGVARLLAAVPDAQVVGFAVDGAVDLVRFPRRPQITVTFLTLNGGGLQPGEQFPAFAARLMADVRALVPPVTAGRGSQRGA